MNHKQLFWAVAVLVLFITVPAQAQLTTKTYRIGYLAGSSLSVNAARIEAFLQGLRDFGYIQDKNIVVEYRAPEGQLNGIRCLRWSWLSLK